MRKLLIVQFIIAGILHSLSCITVAQSGYNDDRVILQGFYWESYRHGNTEFKETVPGQKNGNTQWYDIVKSKIPKIREGHFNIIWLPAPTKCADGAGYAPTEYFNVNNMYGDSAKQRALLTELWKNGIEPVADIVINHRTGTFKWADFSKPYWKYDAICNSDEAFFKPESEINGLPEHLRGADEETVLEYDSRLQKAFAYESFRDIDHTNPIVHIDILRYLLYLKSMGYRGWRYDMVHGYNATHIAEYNKYTKPTFSVGEYDWNNQDAWRGWVYYTASYPVPSAIEQIKTSSDVFDFSTYYSLKSSIGTDCGNQANYLNLYAFGNGLGLMGDNTDGIPWKNRAVTFLENHDTGWRTHPDGSTQKHNEKDSYDSFSNNWQVEQGYAYILTHPGIPCVYWKHYNDWGNDLQSKIIALINARKVAGINSGSAIYTQENAKNAKVYAAMVAGTNGQLFVRIGGNDSNWEPSKSSYTGYREYAAGNGWKVWVKLNNNALNASVQRFPLTNSLGNIPLPELR